MAVSETKDEDYRKRQEAFHNKLLQFHRDNNNYIKRFPLLGGKELDLYHLYLKVKSLGGSKRITQERQWGEVARSFNLPPSVTSASYACRQNFIKYLEPYERYEAGEPVYFPSPSTSPSISLLSHPPQRKLLLQPSPTTPIITTNTTVRNNIPTTASISSKLPHLATIPGFDNLLKQFDKTPELLGQISSMPSLLQLPPNQLQLVQLLIQQLNNLKHGGQGKSLQSLSGARIKCDWVIRSLQSGFPNEVDLAMNTLLIMSMEERVLVLTDIPQLLTILLAHVGVFSIDDDSTCLESLYHQWYPNKESDFVTFWQEVTPEWACLSSLSYHLLQEDKNNMDCFPCKSVLTDDCIESFRVHQIALVMRNLSFDEINAKFMRKSESLLRFLLLCLNCSIPQLKSHCLDILVNLGSFLVIEEESVSHLILTSIYSCILSSDRNSVLKGIEILGELSYIVYNTSILSYIPSLVLHKLIQYSLLPDYLLVQTSLDTLYCLSFYGGKMGEMILQIDHSISTLLNLLTIGIQGNDILGDLLLIYPNGKELPAVTAIQPLNDGSTVSKLNTSSTTPLTSSRQATPNKTTPLVNTPTSPAHLNHQTMPTNRQATPTFIQTTPSSSTKTKKASSKPTNNKPVETTNSNDEINKISFVSQWLQSEYVISHEEYIPKLEMYSKYLTHCAQLRYTTAVAHTEFYQIIRKVFPSITSTTVKLAGQDIELIGGIGKRNGTSLTAKSSSPQISLKSSNKISPTPSLLSNQNNKSPLPSSSPPSLSRSPSPSLSPLQQLIQATKTASKNAVPSPLLKSKKVPHNNSIKLKRPQVNGAPVFANPLSPLISHTTSASLPVSVSPLSTSSFPVNILQKSSGVQSNKSDVLGSCVELRGSEEGEIKSRGSFEDLSKEERKVINGTTEGLDLLRKKLFGSTALTSKRERNSIESDSPLYTKKQKTELSEITNRSWTPPSCTNSLLLPTTTVSLSNNTSLHSSSSESIQRSESLQRSDSVQKSSESIQRSDSVQRSSESIQRSDSIQRSSESIQMSVSPVDKRSTSPSVLSSASSVKPHLISDSSNVEQIQSVSSAVTKYSCLWNNCQLTCTSYDDLFTHIYYSHISLLTTFPTPCLWMGCISKCKRMRPSLLRHVQTHHCSSDPRPVPLNVADTLLKLKMISPIKNEQESCLTRCLRLTVGLILRNLLEKVPSAHKHLKPYERLLSQVAFSNDEASHVAAHCLYLLSSSPLPTPTPPGLLNTDYI